MTIMRQLGGGERVFWLRPNRPTHVVWAYEIAGNTSVDDWSAALAALQRRHSLLSAGIRNDENGRPSFHASTAAIQLHVVPGSISDDWEREMENELATVFDLSRSTLLRAILFHEPTRVILLPSAVHSITDGMSGTFLRRDLLTEMSGGHLDPLPPAARRWRRCSNECRSTRCLRRGRRSSPAGRTPVPVADDARPCVTRRTFDAGLTAAGRGARTRRCSAPCARRPCSPATPKRRRRRGLRRLVGTGQPC